MNTVQRIISAVMAITIVVAAIVCHYQGIPGKVILLVAGIMLANLWLQTFWVKKSVARARGLMVASMLAGLFLIWYIFKVSLALLIPGAIFLFVVMFVNTVWMKSATAKANARIVQWATENGWRLLEFNREFNTGPFGGFHGRAEMYFQFVICDRQGNRHTGWACFDFSLFGGGRYQVKWIEDAKQSSN